MGILNIKLSTIDRVIGEILKIFFCLQNCETLGLSHSESPFSSQSHHVGGQHPPQNSEGGTAAARPRVRAVTMHRTLAFVSQLYHRLLATSHQDVSLPAFATYQYEIKNLRLKDDRLARTTALFWQVLEQGGRDKCCW